MKLKLEDTRGFSHEIIAENAANFSHGIDKDNGWCCTEIEIEGKIIFANCHLLDFINAWDAVRAYNAKIKT